MGDKLPIWSYSNSGDREKIASTYPYYLSENDNFYGMVKLGKISSGWDDSFERTSENFLKKSSLSFDLVDVVKRICGEEDTDFGSIIIGPISNERNEEGELVDEEIGISLNLNSADVPQLLEKTIKSGFGKQDLISYPSIDNVRFNINGIIRWNGGGPTTNYRIECWIKNTETVVATINGQKDDETNFFTFYGLPAYDEDGNLIIYQIKEILESQEWTIENNDLVVSYNNYLDEVVFINSYVEELYYESFIISNEQPVYSRGVTFTPTCNGIAIAICENYGTSTPDIEIEENNGWELVEQSNVAQYGGFQPCIYVWKKIITKNVMEQINFTSEHNTVGGVAAFVFSGNMGVSVVQNIVVPSFPFEPILKSNNRRLYLFTYVKTSTGNSPQIETSSDDIDTFDGERFLKFCDYTTDSEKTSEFSYINGLGETGYPGNSAVCLTLDIIEE